MLTRSSLCRAFVVLAFCLVAWAPGALAQQCGNGKIDAGETCDPPGMQSQCAAGNICRFDCQACVPAETKVVSFAGSCCTCTPENTEKSCRCLNKDGVDDFVVKSHVVSQVAGRRYCSAELVNGAHCRKNPAFESCEESDTQCCYDCFEVRLRCPTGFDQTVSVTYGAPNSKGVPRYGCTWYESLGKFGAITNDSCSGEPTTCP